MLYFTFSPSFDTFTSYALWNSLCVGVSPSSAHHWSRNQPHTRAILKVWFSQSSLLSHFWKTYLFWLVGSCIASFFVSGIEIYSLNNTCWALCRSRLGSVPLAPLGFFFRDRWMTVLDCRGWSELLTLNVGVQGRRGLDLLRRESEQNRRG